MAEVARGGGAQRVNLPAGRPEALDHLGHLGQFAVDGGVHDRVAEHPPLGPEALEQESSAGHFVVEEHPLVGETRRRAEHGHRRVALQVHAAEVLDEVEGMHLGETFPPVRAEQGVEHADQLAAALTGRPLGDVVGLDIDDELVAAKGLGGGPLVEGGVVGHVEEGLAVGLVNGEQAGGEAPPRPDIVGGRQAEPLARPLH